jgi:hypothetical protein
MSDTPKMVNVKLAARCLVNGQIREADEIVDLPEMGVDANGKPAPFAISFGKIVEPKSATPPPIEKPNV